MRLFGRYNRFCDSFAFKEIKSGGTNPVICRSGGIGRHEGLKIPWLRLYGFKSRLWHHCTLTELLLLRYANIRSSKATSMVVGKFVVVKGKVKLSKQIGIYSAGRVVGEHVILIKYVESIILYASVVEWQTRGT